MKATNYNGYCSHVIINFPKNNRTNDSVDYISTQNVC